MEHIRPDCFARQWQPRRADAAVRRSVSGDGICPDHPWGKPARHREGSVSAIGLRHFGERSEDPDLARGVSLRAGSHRQEAPPSSGGLVELAAVWCETLFEEKISGAQRQRPERERLLAQLRKGDVLVVTRLDRLARSTAELPRIAEVITEKNAGLQSLDEPWADTTTPSGRMIPTVFAGIAEFERHPIRSRSKDGRRAAQARGVAFGRPRTCHRLSLPRTPERLMIPARAGRKPRRWRARPPCSRPPPGRRRARGGRRRHRRSPYRHREWRR